MSEHIYQKRIKGKIYYYLQRTWREKVDQSNNVKHKGNGCSRVRTESKYLGSAENIIRRLTESREPVEAHSLEFGLVGATYQTAVDIGLVDLLKEYIEGERYGIERWKFFLLTIINRLQNATSKESMGKWVEKTILPQILDFEPKKINSKNFWTVTEDIINEKELKKRRQENPDLVEELFVGIDDEIFQTIEEKLFIKICKDFNITSDVLLYDTTNFFTYIEEPVRSKLARTGHSKEGRDNKKQIGLSMCVDKEFGIPMFYRIYRGNSHDSKTFSGIIDMMIGQLRLGFKQIKEMVLVMDKGNNSKANFKALQGKIKWIGSLVLSQFIDLENLPLDKYSDTFDGLSYYRCKREVMGIESTLVLTYNNRLAVKQNYSLFNGIEKLEQKIQSTWAEYKRKVKKVPSKIKNILKESHYGNFLKVNCHQGKPIFFLNTSAIEEHRKSFGKNLLFSCDEDAETSWIIMQYKAKTKIEEDFKLIKSPDLIRWRPIRHWTDTKIRAFGFCCIMALVIIRIMQVKAAKAGLEMSAAVLKQELSDLRQVIMIYDDKTAHTKITQASSIQKGLSEVFNLNTIESLLTIHKKT